MPEQKPSKGARELAEKFRDFLSKAFGMEIKWTEQGAQELPEIIQSALADLLEKVDVAEYALTLSGKPQAARNLAKAAELWKPE